MNDLVPSGNITFLEIVEAIQILQKAGLIDETAEACEKAGFRMMFADLSHGIMIGEELQKAINKVREMEPDYYADTGGNEANILVGGPCPCRRR